MDKNAIKKYAVWARRELISRVSQRAALYDITEQNPGDPNADSVRGEFLPDDERKQRKALIEQIQRKGYTEVIEEVAYTWFNRFIALRFMEVNGYLPTHIRVFTAEDNSFKPQIITEAINLELDGLNMQKVYDLKNASDDDALFKYLIITQCNALSSVLPGMFQKIADYTELLFPDNLLLEGSVIEQMITLIPESDWQDQVQIIGWLYEGYNTERNELVYDGSMSKSRISKELLPAATTIFTPDWPIRYMVENSLGRLWVEGHPNDDLKSNWKYYLEEAEQEPNVQIKLAEIRKEYAALNPEDIKVIDPCCGSGHILAYMFDVLVQIYESNGYVTRDAVKSIVENNLYGLDIDDRAAQLAYFSVMMKARQYDGRFFKRGVQPHVYAIEESNGITTAPLHDMGIDLSQEEYGKATKQVLRLIDEMRDAKEYGSILNVTSCDWELLRRFAVPRGETTGQLTLDIHGEQEASAKLQKIITVAETLAQKYHIIVTNPPYLGNSRFSPLLDKYVKENYADVKSDLSMVMYKHAITDMAVKNGFVAFITTSSWMFLSSFEKLRNYQQTFTSIRSIVDYGTELFEGKVGHNPIVSWICTVGHIASYKMKAVRLVDFCYSRRDEKEPEFFKTRNHYAAQQDNFEKIPGSPVAYWVSEKVLTVYKNSSIYNIARPCKGIDTGDNSIFLRLWFEIKNTNIFYPQNCPLMSADYKKWHPYNKGGNYRHWYGNNEYVLLWNKDGQLLKNFSKSNLRNKDTYFQEGITWSTVTSGTLSVRYFKYGYLFDNGGSCLFSDDKLKYILAYLNSKVVNYLMGLSPTLNTQPGDIGRLPICTEVNNIDTIENIADENIRLSKEDWDSFETSWDFQLHPLLPIYADGSDYAYKLELFYHAWAERCEQQFNQLKSNEEALNRIFIDIYGLQDELTPEIEDKDVTVRKADLQRDIRSLISYAVGCMFGRYSLDELGLAYAGGEWDASKYRSFPADKDNIIPICDDEYFEDDIVNRFVKFIEIVYGKDTLEENLKFIADALGGKDQPREVIRNYFMNDFFADHLKVYQKRPIYWLFDSGKKNGFKCLIYMHRYQPDTIARIRTDYVHEQQSRYRTAIGDLENRMASAGTSERVKLSKQLKKLQDQAEELRVYEEKIHHLADQMIPIDLDDGVKVNYAKFQDVLARIK